MERRSNSAEYRLSIRIFMANNLTGANGRQPLTLRVVSLPAQRLPPVSKFARSANQRSDVASSLACLAFCSVTRPAATSSFMMRFSSSHSRSSFVIRSRSCSFSRWSSSVVFCFISVKWPFVVEQIRCTQRLEAHLSCDLKPLCQPQRGCRHN